MGTNSSKTWILCGIALAVVGRIAGHSAANGEGYLTKVGPAPLRYEAMHTSIPPNWPPLMIEPGDIGEATTVPAQADYFTPPWKPPSPEIPADLMLPSTLWLDRYAGSKSLESLLPTSANPAVNVLAGPSAANDLLALSPQMLVDYFRPGPLPTNGPNMNVLIPTLGFMPATPAGPSSSAKYQSP